VPRLPGLQLQLNGPVPEFLSGTISGLLPRKILSPKGSSLIMARRQLLNLKRLAAQGQR
jgi:hypothetical protein